MTDEERGLIKTESPKIDLAPYVEQFGGKVTILLPVEHARTWSPLHAASVNVVKFSTQNAHKIEGKFMHSKAQLDTMATYAGIKVVSSEVVSTDDQYVFTHQVSMKLLLATGGSVEQTKTKTYDLRDNGSKAERSRNALVRKIKDALAGKMYGQERASYPKYFKAKHANESEEEFWNRANEYIGETVQKELDQARVYGQELAESGAMNRCLRALLGLKMQWTKEEFEWPVIIVTAKIDFQKVFERIGEKVLAQRVMDSAFGALGGTDSGDVAKFLAAMDDVEPEEIIEEPIEAQVVEMPPADIEDALAEQVQEEAEREMQEDSGPSDEEEPRAINKADQAALKNWLAAKGYDVDMAQVNLVRALWGMDIHELDRLQAKITCQYARDVFEETEAWVAKGKSPGTNEFKAIKDGKKVICRQAYGAGRDLDEHIEFMSGQPLR